MITAQDYSTDARHLEWNLARNQEHIAGCSWNVVYKTVFFFLDDACTHCMHCTAGTEQKKYLYCVLFIQQISTYMLGDPLLWLTTVKKTKKTNKHYKKHNFFRGLKMLKTRETSRDFFCLYVFVFCFFNSDMNSFLLVPRFWERKTLSEC